AMQEPLVAVPTDAVPYVHHWGLGWSLSRWDGHLCLGHDGNTDGQRSMLRALPEKGLAIALLTNGGAGVDLAHEALDELLVKAAGLTHWPRPAAIVKAGND